MISAKFSFNKHLNFSISGHANAGEYGNDLVCAGVTAIVSGMLNVYTERYEKIVDIKVENNLITVDFNEFDNNALHDLKILLIQLKTIETQYPENIKIKEVL